jgi:hypothetical protein
MSRFGFFLVLLSASSLFASDLYVSPTGSDANAGSLNSPLATLKAARDKADQVKANGSVTIYLRGGTYYLDTTVSFGPSNSGSPQAPITYKAYETEIPVISGGILLPSTATWTQATGLSSNNIMVTTIAKNLKVDQLFLNGTRQILARYPNYDSTVAILGGYDANCLGRASKWANPGEGPGYMRALHPNLWGGESYFITGKNGSTANTTPVGDNANGTSPHATYRMVENIFEELDAPGEWFYRKSTGELFFYPPSGTNLQTAKIELASEDQLISIKGTSMTQTVSYLTFDGITFTHTFRTLFSKPYERLLSSDWTIARAGAFYIQNANNITIQNCFFDQLGGNGIFISGHNRNHFIYNNKFMHTGASCVCICGYQDAVRCPGPWASSCSDLTPGPQSDDYPAYVTVQNNLIHDFGVFEKQTAAVDMSMCMCDTVRHNSIDFCPRAALNCTDGCWGGQVLEYNDLFNTMRETTDNGPFNSWGRDRNYIGSFQGDSTKTTLDAMYTTVIRNNRMKSGPGIYGIDLDDGSSNYYCYNNLLIGVGLKLQWGRLRHLQNNIVVKGGYVEFHSNWAHNGHTLTHNVFVDTAIYSFCCWSVPDAQVGAAELATGAKVDSNTLWSFGNNPKFGLWPNHNPSTCTWQQWLSGGVDAHSKLADPQFTNEANGDYTVKIGSPALALGFQNFPMDSFGVVPVATGVRYSIINTENGAIRRGSFMVHYCNGRLLISHPGSYQVTITTALGRKVAVFSGKDQSLYFFNSNKVGKGIYFLSLRSQNRMETQKLLAE